MRYPLLPSEVTWSNWNCLSNIASPQWTALIVTRCCNCHRLPSSNWCMSSAPPLRGKTNTMNHISKMLPVFYPISFSAFCPTNSPSICSATRIFSTTPSASSRLIVLGTRTSPCATYTAENLNWRDSLTYLTMKKRTRMIGTDSTEYTQSCIGSPAVWWPSYLAHPPLRATFRW